MIKDIILGFKLLKYGYKLKTNVIMAVLFTFIGIYMEVVSEGTNLIGGFYFMIIGMFVYQMIMSVDVSEYIQTSPMKRKLQITIPVITSTVFYLCIFTFLIIERVILINNMPEKREMLLGSLFQIVIFMLITFMFTSVCYKYFWTGYVVFLGLVFAVIIFMNIFLSTPLADKLLSLPIGIFAIMGYAVIFIGAALETIIGKVLYKKPLSDFAFRGVFKD